MKGKQTEIIVINKTKEICQLYNLVGKDLSNYEVIVDLRKFPFFFPIDIVQLCQTFISIGASGCKHVQVLSDSRYLNDIGLIEFCNTNYVQPNTMMGIVSQTAMPIKRVARENMVQYIDQAKNFLSNYCPGKDLTILNIGLSEFINNVYDHSESPIGAYVFCQYYPKAKSIRFAVSDMGVGIPFKVNGYITSNGENSKTDRECIEWAFEERKTIKSTPKNAGLGLHTIKSFVESTRGRIRMISDKIGMYYNAYNEEVSEAFFVNPMKPFIGTVVDIEIFVDNLQEIDVEEVDFDF